MTGYERRTGETANWLRVPVYRRVSNRLDFFGIVVYTDGEKCSGVARSRWWNRDYSASRVGYYQV